MEKLRYEIISSGKRFLQIDTKMLRDFINSFIAENAFLIYDKPFSFKEEKEFQKSKAKEIDAKECLFVICWDGKQLVGNSEARKEKFKSRHNAIFGLAVQKRYRGKGIGEKLLKMAIREAKVRFKAKYLWLDHADGNVPARNLYEKVGFLEVTRLKNYIKHSGKYRDKVIMKYSR
jgi:ribosomal protein S18 acetylase RimI-like enzyme